MPLLSGSNSLVAPAFGAALIGFGCFAVLEPLAAYAGALALFGLPHVLSELRYADKRFGRRIGSPLVVLLAVLCGVVAVRAATSFGLMQPALGVPAELAGVSLLALLCARGGAVQRALAVGVGLAIGSGAALAPFDTAIVLSVLHNLTPLGFLWEIAPAARRWRIMGVATAVLVGLPLLVASGWLRQRLAMLGWTGSEADPLAAGPLAQQLYVYVPSWFADSPRAIDLFSGAVLAQGGHYLAVIVVLPLMLKRLDPKARGLAPWPGDRIFALLLAAAGAASLGAFLTMGFAQARLVYGLAAAFHAWVEIPLLILALTGGVQPWSSSPASSDAPLAKNETSMA